MNTTTTPQVQTTQQIDFNEFILVNAHTVFPELIDADSPMTVKMRKHRHPDCLSSNPHYIPEADVFKSVMAWWTAPDQLLALGLYGETGTGKTELLIYIADRLNEPVYIEKVTTGLTGERFEGSTELVTDENGNNITQKRYGTAMTGYINGGLVILDEVDKANEDFGTSLHLFAEGKPYNLSNFSETVIKHPHCRISATANTIGDGGSDRYITSQRMDSALRARFGWLGTQFLSPMEETNLLAAMYPNLPTLFIAKMIKTANVLRDALLGPDRDGNIEEPISCVFSTRTVVNWGYYTMAFGTNRRPLAALEFSFFGSVDEEELPIVKTILQRLWGDDLEKPLKNVLAKMNTQI
ncbi:AAA family ATPase (plasmid) [Psychrobium sp. nBUS_13]|uniref:AAA family ATPase n=1 Tax=Psychrobium sp. nBUS_13 TaxID=3395319 RepID=UPI003EB71149